MTDFLKKEDTFYLLKEDGDKIILDQFNVTADAFDIVLPAPFQVSFTGDVRSYQRVSQQTVEVANVGNDGKIRVSEFAAEASNTGTQIQRISTFTAENANTGTQRQRMSQFLVEIVSQRVKDTSEVYFIGF